MLGAGRQASRHWLAKLLLRASAALHMLQWPHSHHCAPLPRSPAHHCLLLLLLPQTAALALGGPQEVPFSEGGRSWYTVFDEQFELIQVGVDGRVAGRPAGWVAGWGHVWAACLAGRLTGCLPA